MHYKKVMPVTLLIISLFLTVLFTAWLNPPVTISLKFDPHTQIVSASLTNESDRNLDFDGFTLETRKQKSKEIPTNLYVKIFSKDGKVISKYSWNEGYISGPADMQHNIRPIPLQDMSTLAPHQVITAEARLYDLLAPPLYGEMRKLQDFCVQFMVAFNFNPYGLFIEKKETEIFCVENVIKTEK